MAFLWIGWVLLALYARASYWQALADLNSSEQFSSGLYRGFITDAFTISLLFSLGIIFQYWGRDVSILWARKTRRSLVMPTHMRAPFLFRATSWAAFAGLAVFVLLTIVEVDFFIKQGRRFTVHDIGYFIVSLRVIELISDVAIQSWSHVAGWLALVGASIYWLHSVNTGLEIKAENKFRKSSRRGWLSIQAGAAIAMSLWLLLGFLREDDSSDLSGLTYGFSQSFFVVNESASPAVDEKESLDESSDQPLGH